MKITIESTDKITTLQTPTGSVQARIWEGVTERGVPVLCFVTRIAPIIPRDDPRQSDFQKELLECAVPTVPGIPLRMII